MVPRISYLALFVSQDGPQDILLGSVCITGRSQGSVSPGAVEAGVAPLAVVHPIG